MTAAIPAPPPVDAGLEALMRRMRLPHMRAIAPEVIATAKAQRWDPAEVLRTLLAAEVAGRDRSALAASPSRIGSDPAEQLATGHVWWPSPGRSDGHQRAALMTASGQFLMSLDRKTWPQANRRQSGAD